MLFSAFIFLSSVLAQGVSSRIVPMIFILFPLILLSGLQLDVGTDYQSYFWRAESGNAGTFTRKYEYGFALIIWLSKIIDYPQSVFLISSFLQYTFLLCFCNQLLKYYKFRRGVMSIFLFFILLFYANVAANQLNLLRFYIALPVFGMFLLNLQDGTKLYRSLFLGALASSFHFSFVFLSLLALGLHFFKIGWRGAIVLGLLVCSSFVVIFEALSEIYLPLSRVGSNLDIQINIGPTDFPLMFSYLITLIMHLKQPTIFRPFVVVHFIMILFIFGPEPVSQRLSYLVYFLTVSISLVAFRPETPVIARQAQILIYLIWFVLPAYKFLIFGDMEYGYQWVL